MLKVVGASWAQTQLSWCLIITITLLGLLAFYFSGTIRNEYDGKYAATAFWSKEFGLRIDFCGQNNDPLKVRKGVARAYYRPDLTKNGWAVLEVETQAEYPDYVQAKAAGNLEGSLTWQMIYWQWKNTVENTCAGRKKFCDKLRKYLEENLEEIKRKMKRYDETEPFWHQVNLFYTQLKALEDGWRFGVKRSRQDIDIPSIDFLWMNIMPDLRDFEQKWNASKDFNQEKPPLSATIIKIVETNPIEYVLAQSTSGYYGSMLRIQKRYNFGFHETGSDNSTIVNGKIIEFTSYPGSIYSQDDFYKITKKGSNLETTVVGTEIRNNNRQLWEKIMKPDQYLDQHFGEKLKVQYEFSKNTIGTLSEDNIFDNIRSKPHVIFLRIPTQLVTMVLLGARVMAANRLAGNSKKWHEMFLKNNSGTGNKQWLFINANNKSIEFGVTEQLPGIVGYEELSKSLLSTGYWISNSYPSLGQIGYISNNGRLDSPVAKVLRKGQQNVTDIGSMVELMRGTEISMIGRSDLLGIKTYVEFHRFSNRSYVEQLINGRRLKEEEEGAAAATTTTQLKNDRMTAIVANKLLAPAAAYDEKLDIDKSFTGLLDLKVTSTNMNGFFVAAGPPYTVDCSDVEPFQWSDSPIRYVPHYGHPDIWDYDLEGIEWVWNAR